MFHAFPTKKKKKRKKTNYNDLITFSFFTHTHTILNSPIHPQLIYLLRHRIFLTESVSEIMISSSDTDI